MFLAGRSKEDLTHVKNFLKGEFDMKDLREASKVLEVKIHRNKEESIPSINQSSYCEKILKMFNMNDVKPVSLPIVQHFKLSLANSPKDSDQEHHKQMAIIPYSQAVGSLMYLMISTRPDLSYSTSLVSRYMSNPGKIHWKATKWILRYLIWFKNSKLVYQRSIKPNLELYGYMDADYAGDLDKRRSLTSYLFLFGPNLISWKASLQPIVALSTTEAEYMTLIEAIKEALWLKGLLKDFEIDQTVVKLYCDN
ncbi:secreted RxLR effector protein 161-like [Benincasa hispida]|uniref:secreted RxLR effector protein 161-like n=1 Tax=Benincasa hispida TaxID=102211 RepID=UPI0019005C34|nr:secreted RxLR effector protein 161-like [Benincasa hispida]